MPSRKTKQLAMRLQNLRNNPTKHVVEGDDTTDKISRIKSRIFNCNADIVKFGDNYVIKRKLYFMREQLKELEAKLQNEKIVNESAANN